MDAESRDEGRKEEEEEETKRKSRRREGRKVCLDKWSPSDLGVRVFGGGGLSERFRKEEGRRDGQLRGVMWQR